MVQYCVIGITAIIICVLAILLAASIGTATQSNSAVIPYSSLAVFSIVNRAVANDFELSTEFNSYSVAASYVRNFEAVEVKDYVLAIRNSDIFVGIGKQFNRFAILSIGQGRAKGIIADATYGGHRGISVNDNAAARILRHAGLYVIAHVPLGTISSLKRATGYGDARLGTYTNYTQIQLALKCAVGDVKLCVLCYINITSSRVPTVLNFAGDYAVTFYGNGNASVISAVRPVINVKSHLSRWGSELTVSNDNVTAIVAGYVLAATVAAVNHHIVQC